jgi:hypothetical protein
MGPEELLRPACELSYTVARDGAESKPVTDPPAAMTSFLYVDELPARALVVAQQAIEEDPSFRRRVAELATEDEVGRAGFLWLHRPIGWAAEFEELTMGLSGTGEGPEDEEPTDDGGPEAASDQPAGDEGDAPAEEPETVSAVGFEPEPEDLDEALVAEADQDSIDAVQRDQELVPVPDAATTAFGSIDVFGNGSRGLELQAPAASRGRSEANAIEDELLSLRGLVDRLSNERKAVSSSVRQAEQDLAKARYQPSMFDSDVYTLQSELEGARAELDAARRDRDTAIRQHSESLTRQLDLEKELERSRELRAEIEREHAEADAGIIDVREALARAEASLATVEADRDELGEQLAMYRADNEDLKLQVNRLTEVNATQKGSLEAQHKALQSEAETLRADSDALAARLAAAENDLTNARAQLSQTGNQAAEAKSLVDALTEEKIDLASRLADTEAMLETTRAQLGAVKSDAETVASDLVTTRSHRDGLATQVDELHNGLTEALSDLARVRAGSDADRAGLKEVRAERDLLRVRVGSLEQIEKGLEAKLATISSERDTFAVRTDQAKAELAERERLSAAIEAERDRVTEDLATAEESNGTLVAERDELRASLDGLQTRATELELARDGLAVQVEQLTGESLAIQGQMVEKDRQQQEASDNQGRALSELAHRLAMAENDRSRLEAELQESEQQLAEALVAVQMAMDTAEKARQGQIALEAQAARAAEQLAAATAAAAAGGPGTAPDPVPAVLSGPGPDGSTLVPPSAFDLPGPAPWAEVPEEDGPDQSPVEDEMASGFVVAEPGGDGAVEDESAGEVWPPPPGPDAVPSVLEGSARTEPLEAGSPARAEEARPDVERPAKRHVWSFGSRFRNDNEEADRADRGYELEAPAPLSDDAAPAAPDPEAADLAPAPAPVAVAATEEEAAPVAEGLPEVDELEAISSELSQAVEDVGLLPSPDDEDLDEISKLIKQTVTDFDPSSLKLPSVDGPAALVGDPDDEPRRRTGRSRRLFASRPADQWRDDDGPDGSNGVAGSAMSSHPPSVFGDDGRLTGTRLDPDQTLVVKGGPLDTPGAAFEAGAGPRSEADREAGERSRPGRRQIELPTDIDDDVELARRIVSSPDVVLLVDGDSVAKMGWPSLPVAQQRDALVSYLADLSSSTGVSPDVVFDGRIGEEEALPASRAVRIRLSTSTPPIEPAAALDELVDAYPEQWPIAVVTDDPDLTRSVQDRGATVLNNGQLLDLFIVQ